ncbi:MAG: metallophosphoesterase [Planctomycetes bacterium]|nr:metallophosphoesterase [Planctomycetota bacterium]
MITVLYNGLLLLADAAAFQALRRSGSRGTIAGILVGTSFAALLLAGLLGGNFFGISRLLSCGLFLHGPLLLGLLAARLQKDSRKTAWAAAILAALLALVAADAFLIEPNWLEVSRVTLRSPKLRRPLRIVVIADFQTDHVGDYERRVIWRTLQEKPDLILMAGDHLQEQGPALAPLRGEFRRLFADLRGAAPLGVFAVRGNIDPPDWTILFDGLPITTIDATQSIDLPDFRLTGLSMEDSFRSTLAVSSTDRFHIVLGHSPDFALGEVRADLLIAGHTHGGQVRLPGIGPLMTLSRVPRAWAAGATALGGGRTLVVSRGIGMERGAAPRLRFLCRPELVVIDAAP